MPKGRKTIYTSQSDPLLAQGFSNFTPRFKVTATTGSGTSGSGGDASQTRASTSGGEAIARRDNVPLVEAPDVETTNRIARRRFAAGFRDRWKERKQRRRARREAARLKSRLPGHSPGKSKRKRTALALGVSALSLSGASNVALSADPIAAEENAASEVRAAAMGALVDISERRHASELSVSDDMIEVMIEEEGVRYDVYRDVAGYPTVGVGHLVLPRDNLRLGDTISHERAIRLLESDLKKAEAGVRNLVGDLPLNQNEFDALVDLVFNVGEGTVSKRKSPRLNAAIADGDYERIAEELDYRYAANRVAKGLIYRSERRSEIFMSADYSDPREAGSETGNTA